MVAWLTKNTDKTNNQKYKLIKDLDWCLHKNIYIQKKQLQRLLDTQEPL